MAAAERRLTAVLTRVVSAEERVAELERQLQAAALREQQGRLREAELRAREAPASSYFGGTVRSKEKFERQLELTQELERLLLCKDQEIAKLVAITGTVITEESSAAAHTEPEPQPAAGRPLTRGANDGGEQEL